MAMISLLRKMNVGENGQPLWRDPRDGRSIVPHGFRATFRTWAEDETHYPRAVIEQAMGHQVGTEVERAYRRTDVLEKRKALMADWADAQALGCDFPVAWDMSTDETALQVASAIRNQTEATTARFRGGRRRSSSCSPDENITGTRPI
jgi:hypothetical protein